MALHYFCFCCRLESFALFWGAFSTFFDVLAFIEFRDLVAPFITVYDHKVLYEDLPNEIKEAADAIDAYIIMCKMFLSCHVIASVLLTYGAITKKHGFMLPWLMINSIFLVILCPIAVIAVIMAFPIFFPYYVWWCIHSTRVKLQKAEQMIAPLTNITNNINIGPMGHSIIATPASSMYVPSPTLPSYYPSAPSFTMNSSGANKISDDNDRDQLISKQPNFD